MDIIDLRDVIENREDDPETYEVWSRAVMEDLAYAQHSYRNYR